MLKNSTGFKVEIAFSFLVQKELFRTEVLLFFHQGSESDSKEI